jgi:hypothetical protein
MLTLFYKFVKKSDYSFGVSFDLVAGGAIRCQKASQSASRAKWRGAGQPQLALEKRPESG